VNDHTLADFRVRHEEAMDDLLTQSVASLMSEGLVELERVAKDGMKVRASTPGDRERASDPSTGHRSTAMAHRRDARRRLLPSPDRSRETSTTPEAAGSGRAYTRGVPDVRKSSVRGQSDARSEEVPMNRKVIALVEDPFWRSKIDNAVKSVGAVTVFHADPVEAARAVDPSAPVIVVVDLALKSPPFEAMAKLKKAKATAAVPVVGYFDMARKDLKEKALAAGFDEVLSRSSFAERFADLVLKYLLPGGVRMEEEENELPEE